MKEKNKEMILTENEKEKLYKNIKWGIVLFAIAVVILLIPKFDWKKDNTKANFSAVDRICELATVKCYFHNVAEIDKDPDNLFKHGLFEYGKKKSWMEYEGIAKLGINAAEVTVSEPDENGVVRIFVPEAELIVVDADEETMTEVVTDTGVFTKISFEERNIAFDEAQVRMEEKIIEDKIMFVRARENAKKLLEQYVVNVGEQIGQEYTVEWVDE